jgi:cyclomaltodextrinase
MSLPNWINSAVFYQIFPDRFANGNPANDPVNVRPWGSPPTLHGFQGGDLRGIQTHLDYLTDLGINAIYLNPIFLSPSTHRYDTVDYLQIDPRLGDEKEFLGLLNAAHSRNIRIILDGVFNHCGRGFFAFSDILENGDQSPYRNWFHIKKFPVNAYGPGDAVDYQAWWNFKNLPKFNTSNPETRAYIWRVVRYWTERGIDGWRLDVPNEINDDAFWAEFTDLVKGINPEAYTIGEIWDLQPRWVGDHHFDGVMHYPLRSALIDLLNHKIKANEFGGRVEHFLQVYPQMNIPGLYLLLGSHDTERIMTLLGGSSEKVKLAFLFLMTYPGVPAIYYGDEIGLEGGKDPDCRRAFPWDESHWNADLRTWVRKLVALRKGQPALKEGSYRILHAGNSAAIFSAIRTHGGESILILINPNSSEWQGEIPLSDLGWSGGLSTENLTGQGNFRVDGGNLHVQVPAWDGLLLKGIKMRHENG